MLEEVQTRGQEDKTICLELFDICNMQQTIDEEFKEFKTCESLKITDNYNDRLRDKFIQIFNSKDKKSFKQACKGFISECLECGLPYGGIYTDEKGNTCFKTIPILWSNNGLIRECNTFNSLRVTLLDEIEYKKFICDTESPPFHLLWSIVRDSLAEVGDRKYEESYLFQIKKHQEEYFGQNQEHHHIVYDKILSEVWVEEFPKILEKHGCKLSDIRIEIGQNTGREDFIKTFKIDSIFCQAELPVLLDLIAEHNIEKPNDKINIKTLFSKTEKCKDFFERFPITSMLDKVCERKMTKEKLDVVTIYKDIVLAVYKDTILNAPKEQNYQFECYNNKANETPPRLTPPKVPERPKRQALLMKDFLQ